MNTGAQAPARVWWVFVLGGTAVTAAYFPAPGAIPPAAIYIGIGAISAGVIALAARRCDRPVRTPWLFIAAAIALFTGGDLIWYWYELVRHVEVPAVSLADVSYLSGYPLLAVGVLLLVRTRTGGRHRDSVLDGVTLALGAAVVMWEVLIAGGVADTSIPLLDRVVLAAYPVMDVLILAVLARLALTESRRLPAYWLLVGGLVLMAGSDVLYAWMEQHDAYPEWIDAGWLLSYVVLGGAALHPSARRLAEPVDPPASRLTPVVTLLLAASMLAAPVVLAAHVESPADRFVLVALFVGLTASVLLRMRALVVDKDRDLHDLARAQEELSHLAVHDALTGLPNRTLFLDRLDQALARREAEGRVAVLFVDLDRFKVLNDSAGHALGDDVLCAVARRLRDAVRPEDTVARFGGDEFTVLCEGVDGTAGATRMAERLAAAVARPITTARGEVVMSASIGIALGDPRGAPDGASLLRDADSAMYRAKQRGRDRYEVFDEGMRVWAVSRLETVSDLRRAVDRGELVLHFQPEVVLASGELFAMEALLRWNHPTRGLVAPADFIPVAEDSGLIVGVGDWVLGAACMQVARWKRDLGADAPAVSVNLSARQLVEPDLADRVFRALDGAGVGPSRLCVEITESALLDDTDIVRGTLGRLRDHGVLVALDDFGTGYSSLSHLRRVPVDLLKIDRSFVQGLGRDPEDERIVRAIVDMARALGLRTVAEGVERAEQAEQLVAFGCDVAQGSYFGSPTPTGGQTRDTARVTPPATQRLV